MPQLTQRQIKLNYWLVTHKAQLKKVLIISLIVLNMGFWGYSIYSLIIYFSTTKNHEIILKNFSQGLIDWPAYHTKNKPQDLVVYEITVIPLSRNRYDLVAQVENPNEKWAILDLDYRFVWPGSIAPASGQDNSEADLKIGATWRKNFFLPGGGSVAPASMQDNGEADLKVGATWQKKFLLGLNLVSSEPIKNPRIEFQNIQWRRLSEKQKNLKIDKLKIKKSDFLLENIRFVRKTEIFSSKLQFEVINKTNYNFWQVNFLVIFYQGQKIVGANFVSVSQFLSGEKRSQEIFWTEPLPTVTKVYIEPEVNLLDPEAFMKIEGGVGEEK